MMFQDWILPIILAVIIFDIGLIWGIRRWRNPEPDSTTNVMAARFWRLVAWLKRIQVSQSLMAAGIILLLAASMTRPGISEVGKRWVLLPIVAGATFLLGSLGLEFYGGAARQNRFPARLMAVIGLSQRRFSWFACGLVFSLTAAISANYSADVAGQKIAVLAWGLGVISIVLAGLPARFKQTLPTWQEVIWIAFCLSTAFLIRGLVTSRIPGPLSGDEGSFGLSAVRFITGETANLFEAGSHSFPSLYFFLQSNMVRALGQTAQALRLSSAVVGAVTVVGVYWYGREFGGIFTGVLAAIFLAGFHFHIHFSRIGLNNVWDGLWFVVTSGFLWHGWRTGKSSSLVMAGLGLGFGQYFYATGRVLLILVPLWASLAAWIERLGFKQLLSNLGMVAFPALVVVMPLAWFYSREPDMFLGPIRAVTIFGPWLQAQSSSIGRPEWAIVAAQVWESVKAYTSTPLRYWYMPGTPILRTWAAGLFLVSAGVLLVRQRHTRTLLLALWILAITLVGAFSESVPAAQRYIAVAPALSLIIGFGFSEFVAFISVKHPQLLRSLQVGAIMVMVLVGVSDLRFYFQGYARRADFGGYGARVSQKIADHLAQKTSDWQLVYFGNDNIGYHSIPSLRYLTPHIQGLDMRSPWGSPANPDPGANKLVFIFLPGSEDSIDAVRQSYPGGELVTELDPEETTLFWLYEYP